MLTKEEVDFIIEGLKKEVDKNTVAFWDAKFSETIHMIPAAKENMKPINNELTNGKVIVLSGFSGSGKNTCIKYLLNKYAINTGKGKLRYNPSYSSRKMRKGESMGNPYHFIAKDKFKDLINSGDILEYEIIHGNYYGSRKSVLEDSILKNGEIVINDMGVEGFMRLKSLYGNRVVGVFLTVPSLDDSFLKGISSRISNRGDSPEIIQNRLKRVYYESLFMPLYDYVLSNDNLEETLEIINKIYIEVGGN